MGKRLRNDLLILSSGTLNRPQPDQSINQRESVGRVLKPVSPYLEAVARYLADEHLAAARRRRLARRPVGRRSVATLSVLLDQRDPGPLHQRRHGRRHAAAARRLRGGPRRRGETGRRFHGGRRHRQRYAD